MPLVKANSHKISLRFLFNYLIINTLTESKLAMPQPIRLSTVRRRYRLRVPQMACRKDFTDGSLVAVAMPCSRGGLGEGFGLHMRSRSRRLPSKRRLTAVPSENQESAAVP